MTNFKEKLDQITAKEPSKWVEQAKWEIQNEDWLELSTKIALKVLRTIRKNKISQKELAEKLNVSPQQVSKIVSGKENLTIDTITRIEKALKIKLIEVPLEPIIKFSIPKAINKTYKNNLIVRVDNINAKPDFFKYQDNLFYSEQKLAS